MATGNQPDTLIQHRLQRCHIQSAGSIHRNRLNAGTLLRRYKLPGHDIGMVLHRRHQHAVTGLQIGPPPTGRHQIDALGGASGPDYLARLGCVDKRGNLGPCGLELLCRPICQRVSTAMNVAVVLLVVVDQRLNHRARLLRGRGVIQIHQWVAVDLLIQDRKVGTHALGVERQRFSGGEKKRNEIMQMMLLEPDLCILDETDSGLDIDALQVVADGVNAMRDGKRSFLVVTHYQRLLDYIVPDYVHVLAGGRIVKSGDKSLALELEAKGYGWLENEVV